MQTKNIFIIFISFIQFFWAESYEAEKGEIIEGHSASELNGYSGEGYVDLDDKIGSFVDVQVLAPVAGIYLVSIQWGNDFTEDRSMEVYANYEEAKDLVCPGGEKFSWKVTTVRVSLNKGANSIKLLSSSIHGGPFIDAISLEIEDKKLRKKIKKMKAESLKLKGGGLLYEAEQAESYSGNEETDHLGFSGKGFVNIKNSVGSFIQWHLENVKKGKYTLVFRYANGSDEDRNMEIGVNGKTVIPEFPFPNSGGWKTWVEMALPIDLDGGKVAIRATSIVRTGGPNMDYLKLVPGKYEAKNFVIESKAVLPEDPLSWEQHLADHPEKW